MEHRVGLGYDVHRLEENKKLIIGGINIPHSKGPVAHSDGDVLIHAICDALLGAASLGDIGTYFPDTDSRYKNADSRKLLDEVVRILGRKNFKIGNIDTVVCLQRPKINHHIESIKSSLTKVLQIERENISVKATTTEKLGFVGEEKGISAYAVALLYREKNG